MEWLLTIVFGSLALFGIWLRTGSIETDQTGITKTVFWHKKTLKWEEITDVWLLPNNQGIKLNAAARQLIVDMRFIGRAQLLDEISQFTGLNPKHKPSRPE